MSSGSSASSSGSSPDATIAPPRVPRLRLVRGTGRGSSRQILARRTSFQTARRASRAVLARASAVRREARGRRTLFRRVRGFRARDGVLARRSPVGQVQRRVRARAPRVGRAEARALASSRGCAADAARSGGRQAPGVGRVSARVPLFGERGDRRRRRQEARARRAGAPAGDARAPRGVGGVEGVRRERAATAARFPPAGSARLAAGQGRDQLRGGFVPGRELTIGDQGAAR